MRFRGNSFTPNDATGALSQYLHYCSVEGQREIEINKIREESYKYFRNRQDLFIHLCAMHDTTSRHRKYFILSCFLSNIYFRKCNFTYERN